MPVDVELGFIGTVLHVDSPETVVTVTDSLGHGGIENLIRLSILGLNESTLAVTTELDEASGFGSLEVVIERPHPLFTHHLVVEDKRSAFYR